MHVRLSWVVFSARGLEHCALSGQADQSSIDRCANGARRSTQVVFSSHVVNDLRGTAPYVVRVGLLCLLAAVLALACDIAPTAAPTATPTPAPAITPTPTLAATPTLAPAITTPAYPTPAPAITPTPSYAHACACDHSHPYAHATPQRPRQRPPCADGYSRRAVRDPCCPSSSPLFQTPSPSTTGANGVIGPMRTATARTLAKRCWSRSP